MKNTKTAFGTYQNQDVHLYTLKNDNGMIVRIANYGATITDIELPDGNHVACGFDTLDGYFDEKYKANSPYFGCTVGRYAGRIKDGVFTIDGKNYSVATNDGPNHLHGGKVGFDKQIWSAETFEAKDGTGVRMTLDSPDGDEGYPGNVRASVSFTLTNENDIVIDYKATTDKETPFTMTNHTYFNLTGFKEDIKGHKVTIHADRFLQPDDTNVPVGEMTEVSGTYADLREGKILKEAFAQRDFGFENYYVFNDGIQPVREVAVAEEPKSGRKLIISTTEPGMLFYTGYYTSDELNRENGDSFGQFRGFCCETSRYPNGPNIENAPEPTLKPGKEHESTTIFSFR